MPAVGLAFDNAQLVSLIQISKAEEDNPGDNPEDVECVIYDALAPRPGHYPELPELEEPFR